MLDFGNFLGGLAPQSRVAILRGTLSWWCRVKISASSDDLDRNNPMTVHQISLRMSPIGASIARFAAIRQLDRVYGSDTAQA
jgi:hypothetical protein